MYSFFNKKINRFREIYEKYDVYLVDLWGVLHNGIKCNPSALFVLDQLKKKNKKVILISNAPRPGKTVSLFLEKLKLTKGFYDFLITSGDVTREYLKNYSENKIFYHLGPERDKDLFKNLEIKISIKKSECDEIVCTGLFSAENETLEKYNKDLDFFNKNNRKFICANPDEVVHRGNKKEYCAGALASQYEKIGGKVLYFGKPYLDIYNLALKKMNIYEQFKGNKIRLLSIGDNLRTDIKGANLLNIDSFLILSGIYKDFFKDDNKNFQQLCKAEKVKNLYVNYYQESLLW